MLRCIISSAASGQPLIDVGNASRGTVTRSVADLLLGQQVLERGAVEDAVAGLITNDEFQSP